MGSVISSVGGALSGLAGGIGGALSGLGPKYVDTDALQGIANQQVAGAQDAQAQLNGLSGQRSQFGQALANQALGNAPSIANAQLQMAMDKNLSQQIAAAHANRSVNPALASRLNVQQANQMAQQTGQQAAVNRLAEQQANQQAFASYLGQQQQAGAQFLGGASNTQSGVMNTQFANQQRGINIFSGLAQAGAQAAMGGGKPMAKGGMVKKGKLPAYCAPQKMADGGTVAAPGAIQNVVGGAPQPDAFADGKNMQQMGGNLGQLLSKLGKPQSQLVAGGPMDTAGMPQDFMASPVLPAAKGALVPGKASVEGDSQENDTVHAMLSPGEVVVPRTVVSKGPKAAASFVAEAIRKNKGEQAKGVQKLYAGGLVKALAPAQPPVSFGSVLAAQTAYKARVAELNKKWSK